MPYQSLSGTPRDFVELLVQKMKNAAKFNQGLATMEYLAASLLDMDWHTLSGDQRLDATAFEKASLEKIGLMPEVGVRYRSRLRA